ncbi:MAG TPA: alkaline phosphatase family protein [Thermoanaerobaculia bacterium]|jgi:phospholipase C|nr:alkaline phosphatase family protein [Thermoanaerobaculia bacterium]
MPIKHVVVVMLENRSYDNVLGWLYNPSNAAPYNEPPAGQALLNGLTGHESNPNPAYDPNQPVSPTNEPTIPVQNLGPTTYGGRPYPATCIPIDDPGEYFDDIAQQITSSSELPTSNPYGTYVPGTAGLMQGFTTNYANLDGTGQQPPPTATGVMNYFTPAQVPVTAFLARNYAVCDAWFASVPAQTFTNRAFALTAAPGVHKTLFSNFSLVDDSQWGDSLTDMTSLLWVLDQVKPPPPDPQWKVYFHDYSIACMTVPYIQQQGTKEVNINVSTFDNSDWGNTIPAQLNSGPLPPTFVSDATSGTLPRFAFLEPRYGTYNTPPFVTAPPTQLPANSNHPGPGYRQASVYAPPIDVASGELFLLQVYNALVSNQTQWAETLLIVTYDEHGGLFDHVHPPLATPPGSGVPEAACDSDSAANTFNFNVFGCRVPAIIISPYIAAGSAFPQMLIVNDAAENPPAHFDHTSIIKTVWDIFGLSSVQASLTDRDANAASLAPALEPDPVNTTGAYTETVICAPSTLVYTADGTQIAWAMSGPTDTLTASVVGDTPPWLSMTSAGTCYLTITVTVSNPPSTSQSVTIQVTSANGATAGTVIVNFTPP